MYFGQDNKQNTLKTSDFTVIERVQVPEGTELTQARAIISPKRDRSHVIRIDLDCFIGENRRVIKSKSVGDRINGERIMRVNIFDFQNLNESTARRLVRTKMDTWLANNVNMEMIKKREHMENVHSNGLGDQINLNEELENANTSNFVMREDYRRAGSQKRIYPNYNFTKRMGGEERVKFLQEEFQQSGNMDTIEETFARYDYAFESPIDSFRSALEVLNFQEDDQLFIYHLQ